MLKRHASTGPSPSPWHGRNCGSSTRQMKIDGPLVRSAGGRPMSAPLTRLLAAVGVVLAVQSPASACKFLAPRPAPLSKELADANAVFVAEARNPTRTADGVALTEMHVRGVYRDVAVLNNVPF